MKQIKRLASLVLAVMMLLSLAIPTFAAEGEDAGDPPATEGTITISVVTSETGAGVAGHTYNVYQIFTGDVAEDGETLTNVAFGANYAPADKTVDKAVEDLAKMSAAEAAATLNTAKTGTPVAVLNDENDHAANVVPGYYLIIDVTEGLPATENKSEYILQVLEPVAIMSKHDAAPITEKKIDDKNDSTGEEDEIEWHDSADHDIGDLIDFKLSAVIPSTIDGFREYNENKEEDAKVPYRFAFHDVEETGLTFTKITSVYVLDGTDKTPITTDHYEVITEGITDGCTFEVVFEDLTVVDAVVAGSTLVVEYQSRLNESAVLGNQGNVNKMRGEYRNLNHPETPNYTPWDFVIAFTYKVVVNKVDEKKEPLAGAEFTLEKYDAATKAWKPIEKVETTAGTTFTFKGLDDGNYRLTETETPNGYNSIDPIEFTVTAEHTVVWTDINARTDVLTSLTGDVPTGEIKFAALENNTGLTTDVENKSGTVLPETGGIGTTIFYTLGGMMVLVAVVLLVTKKRMASAE